ncbi:unnamed protein product [Urochloa humidicola]
MYALLLLLLLRIAAIDELVADSEVAIVDALHVGVDLAERRVVVHVEPAVAALVHDPHRG